MRNKKGVSENLIIFIICCLVLLTIGIVWKVVEKIIEPEFKITKEKCINKTIIMVEYNNCEPNNFTIKEEGRIPLVFAYFSIIELVKEYCEYDYILNTEEFCKQIKVDEVEYKIMNSEWMNECTIPLSNTSIMINITIDGYIIEACYSLIPPSIDNNISKQDLNIEWLDDNCDCKIIEINNMEIPCDYLKCSNREKACSQYKCNDYLVEVKNAN